MYLSVLVVVYCVVSVIGAILQRGLPVLSWQMVSEVPGGEFFIGGKGGFLNAIVGSLYIVGGSTILGLLIALPVVFYLNVYLKPTSRFAAIARLAFDALFGIPSIVYGAFAFTLMVAVGMRASLLGGIIVVTIMIVPMLIRSMDEVAKNIPHGLLESSYSLGSTRIETIGIVLRQIAPAIATPYITLTTGSHPAPLCLLSAHGSATVCAGSCLRCRSSAHTHRARPQSWRTTHHEPL